MRKCSKGPGTVVISGPPMAAGSVRRGWARCGSAGLRDEAWRADLCGCGGPLPTRWTRLIQAGHRGGGDLPAAPHRVHGAEDQRLACRVPEGRPDGGGP